MSFETSILVTWDTLVHTQLIRVWRRLLTKYDSERTRIRKYITEIVDSFFLVGANECSLPDSFIDLWTDSPNLLQIQRPGKTSCI